MMRADELRFYYYPIYVGTLVPITRETIRNYQCQGSIEQPYANILRTFVSRPLTHATGKFDDYNVRILIEDTEFTFAMDNRRYAKLDVKQDSALYLLTQVQLKELLKILKSNPVARHCIESDPSKPADR